MLYQTGRCCSVSDIIGNIKQKATYVLPHNAVYLYPIRLPVQVGLWCTKPNIGVISDGCGYKMQANSYVSVRDAIYLYLANPSV